MTNRQNQPDPMHSGAPPGRNWTGRLISRSGFQTVWATRLFMALTAAILFAAYLANEHQSAGGLGFSSDDAWIHFRFAQNLISGHGFSYNPDQPVAGSTAPLWTLICAGFLGVVGDPVWAGKIAGFLCWILLLWGVFDLVSDLTRSKVAAWGAAILTLLHQRVIWGALSGLEVMLYSALSIWALVLHFRAADDPRRPYFVVTILLFLCGLTRPELFSLVPLFWFDRWWWLKATDSPDASRWREIGVSAGIGVILLAPYLAFNFWTIGKPLPLTFYAKVSPTSFWAALSSGDLGRSIPSVFGDSLHYLYVTYGRFLLAELPGMIGCWYLFWHLGSLPSPARRKTRLLLIIPPYYLLLSAIFTNGVQGAFGRYLTFLYPMLIVLSVAAAWQWWHAREPSSRFFLAASGLLAVAAAIPIAGAVLGLNPVRLFWLEIYPFLSWMPDSIRSTMEENQFLAGGAIAFMLGPFLAGAGGLLWVAIRSTWRRHLASALWGIWTIIAICGAITWAPTCSLAVRNINDLNVATGRWLDTNLSFRATIAVNDIGAIGYFAGRRHIYDLMGLVEPEILPYRRRGEEGIWEYLTIKRPDYLAVFDTWIPSVVQHTDILEKVHSIHAENYILWGYHTMSIYRAHWDRLPK